MTLLPRFVKIGHLHISTAEVVTIESRQCSNCVCSGLNVSAKVYINFVEFQVYEECLLFICESAVEQLL
jgi:hypothetical protein